MARRIRQHVNPLAAGYLQERARPVEVPAALAGAPVEVELGCADGQFSFQLARAQPEVFVVGLDIRDKLVRIIDREAQQAGLSNLRFAYVNVNVDLHRVFVPREVSRFHVLFPDPWFKARHQKRRVIDRGLCSVLLRQLVPGGELHFASDVYELALDAMAQLEGPLADLGFANLAGPWTFWRGNPFAAASRREVTTLARGQRVWRLRYVAP